MAGWVYRASWGPQPVLRNDLRTTASAQFSPGRDYMGRVALLSNRLSAVLLFTAEPSVGIVVLHGELDLDGADGFVFRHGYRVITSVGREANGRV